MTPIQKFKTLVGNRIMWQRAELGLSQRDLAKACQMDPSNLTRIETGQRNWTIDTIDKLATELNLSLAQLFAEGEPDEPNQATDDSDLGIRVRVYRDRSRTTDQDEPS